MFFIVNDPRLIINIALHFGSLLAIIFFYRNNLYFLIDRSNFSKFILVNLPIVLAFVFINKFINYITSLRNISFSNLFASLFLFFVNYNTSGEKNIRFR